MFVLLGIFNENYVFGIREKIIDGCIHLKSINSIFICISYAVNLFHDPWCQVSIYERYLKRLCSTGYLWTEIKWIYTSPILMGIFLSRWNFRKIFRNYERENIFASVCAIFKFLGPVDFKIQTSFKSRSTFIVVKTLQNCGKPSPFCASDGT